MAWRLARALERLRSEANAEWPDRSTISDGTLGDTSHAARKSDHNPALYPGAGPTPVVRAFDITSSGIDHVRYRELVRQLGKAGDRRLNPNGYVISDGRIASAQHAPAWEWHPYDGTNRHDHHVHVSVGTDAAGFDDDRPWGLAHGVAPIPDDGDDDDMFTDQDREDIAAIKRALLIDIAEGRDDLTSDGTVARMVRSMFAGDYGERGAGKYVKGSLGWLDRRLTRLRRGVVADVTEALADALDATGSADLAESLRARVDRGPDDDGS